MIVNERDLAVEVDGSGPAVLFLHGLGGTSNFYQPQAEVLAERFRVIRIDSAGAGRSPVADGISVTSHVGDAAAVLDALGVTSATVVGHSMGTHPPAGRGSWSRHRRGHRRHRALDRHRSRGIAPATFRDWCERHADRPVPPAALQHYR